MADYYTNFSFILPLADAAQKQYALKLDHEARQIREADQISKSFPAALNGSVADWTFELEVCDEGLWLHSNAGGIEAVCAFVQHLLQQFNPAGRVTFEWSHDCSKPRTDAYGGGVAIVTAAEIKTLNTSDWLEANTDGS